MHIEIENLVEGINQIALDVPSYSLSLPNEDGRFEKPVHITGVLLKTGSDLVLQATVSTDALMECSRCLTGFIEHIDGEIHVLYQKTDRVETEIELEDDGSDDIEILDYDAKFIDIARRIEETVRLAMPMKPLCRKECKGLCASCGADLNHESCDCRTETIDPRWQALRSAFDS